MSEEEESLCRWMSAHFPPEESVSSLDTLADGTVCFDLLSMANPAFFPKDTIKRGQTNWVLKKTNVNQLFSSINSYVRSCLGVENFDVALQLNSAVIAKSSDKSQLKELADLTLAICVLSGSSDIIGKIRLCEKPDQEVLQRITKRVMGQHGMRRAEKVGAAGKPVTPTTAAAPASERKGENVSPAAAAEGNTRSFSTAQAAETSPEILRELTTLRHQVSEKDNELNLATSRIELLRKEFADLDARYKMVLEESKAKGQSSKERDLTQQLAKKDANISELNEKLMEYEQSMRDYKQDMARARQGEQDLSLQIDQLKEALKIKTEEKADALRKMTIAQDSLQLNVVRCQELEDEVDAVGQKLTASEKNVQQIKVKLNDATLQLEEKDVQIEDLHSAEEELRRQVSSLESELHFLRDANPNDESDIGHIIDSLREDVSRLQDEKSVLHQNLHNAEDRARLAEKNLTEAREQFAMAMQAGYGFNSAAVAANKSSAPPPDRSSSNKGDQHDDKDGREGHGEESNYNKENETLRAHLMHAAAEIEELKSAQENNVEVKKLREEVERLKGIIRTAKESQRKEHALVISSFFECGQRNLQLQMRHHLGMMDRSKDSAALLFPPESDGKTSAPVPFLEAHRRQFEKGLLQSLAYQASKAPEPRR